MFKKTGETKGHGSIRKNKVYGAIGVLIFGIIAMFSSHEGVVADEIKATKTTALAPVAEASDTSLIVQAKTVAAEVAEAKSLAASSAPVPVSMVAAGNPAEGQPNVTVENQELKDAIATAQASNIEVKQKPTEIIGTANTQEEAANLEADAIAREKEQAQSIRESTDKYNSDYATAQRNTQKPGYLSEVVTQGLNFQSEPNASLSISGTTEFGQQDAPRAYSYEEYIGSGRTFANNPIAAYKTSASGNFVIPKINKDQTITATYTNLQNSSYNGTKIAKVVYEVTNLNNGIGIIGFAEKDPTKGIYTFYNLTAPSKYGVKIRFYDENDNIIQFKQASPAILALTSLSKTIRADGKKHEEGIADYNFKPVKITGSYVEKQSDNRLAASSPTQNIPDRYNHPDFYKTSIAGVIDNGDVISFTMRRDSEFDSGYWLAITSRLPSPFILTKPDLSYNFFSYNTAGTVLLDNYIQGTTTKLTETQIIKPKGTPTGESYVASHEERVHFNGKVYKYVSSSENAMGTVRLGITNVYNYYVEAIGGARVVYLDDDDNKKILETKELMGYYGQTDTYRTTATRQYYQNLHYEVVSDNYPSVGVTYDETIQTFEVHLRHKTVSVEETKTVTETIQYVYEDASQAAESKVQTLEFKRTNTKDLVADRIIQEGVWSPSESTFPAVTSPVIAGYTADHPTVDAVANISATSNDVERKVTYKANAQKLTYTVIDETASRTLADQVLLETGVSKGAVPTQAQTKYDQVVAGYQAQGYELVSQEALPTQFDTDDATDQNVTVRLRHKTVPVEETKTVTETIQYVYEDASQAAESKVQTLEFKRTNTKDLVADRIIQEGVWSPSESTFPAVTSPVIAGYTADHPTVDAVANISATSNDVERKVTYKANAQKLTYTVIDETASRTLADQVLLETGVSKGAVPTQAQTKYDQVVADYQAQGYELVSQEALPTQFDTDDATDQNVTVRLRHKTVPVEETKTVTETIQYVYEDASQAAESKVQTLEFKRTNTKDLVADRIIQEGVWSPSESTFPAVTSPVIAGYTADHPTVDAVANISATSNDVERKVTYKANAQKLTYTVIDETDSRTLADQVLLETGVSKGAVPTQAQTKYDQVVAGYQAQGYELVSQEALPTQFDTDDATDQNVTVRLRHKTVPVEETKTVTETIQYVYEDASQAAESKVQTLEFKRTNTKDLVADRIIQEGVWSPSESTFPAVTSPVIAGYTADHPTVDAVANISATSNDVERKVTYKANAQKLTYTVIDETDSRTLADQVLLETGVSKGAVPTQAQTTYDAVVAGYLAQNYELVSQEALPTQFDTDDATDQNVTVRLRHKTVPVEETKTVTETIQYVYEDASQAAESKVQTLEFKRTNTKDLVADRIIQEGVWSPSESTFPAVTSPVIAGYTADHPTVDAVANISATSNDVERKVTYKANAQKLTYTVIDETDSRTLADQVLLETGVSKGAVPTQAQTTYDAVVAGYLAQNYELVSQEALPTQFDTDDATDQNVTVRLRHKTVPVEETKTVTETIQYVYEDASQAAESKVQTLEFKRTNTKDLVADRIIQEGVWSPSESTFPAVTSPVIAGYTADHPTVDAVANISATSNDVERKVTYKANAQKLTYTVIDETDSRTLADQVLLETGVSKGAVPTQAQTKYDQVVAGYQAQGYELVSQEALPTQFDTDDATDQNVTVRLRHKTVPVEETKTVTETIQYVYEDASQAAESKVQTLEFKRTNTKDLVADRIIQEGVWSPSESTFPAVTSPVIAGYTADHPTVDAVANISATSNDVERKVTYKANAQKLTYTVIDETDSRTLADQVLLETGVSKGAVPTQAQTTYDAVVAGYLAQNYELVSQEALPTQFDTDDATDQNVTVRLRHKTVPVEETKTVTETIQYVYEDASQAAESKVQTLEFKRTNTKDLVADRIIQEGVWSPSESTFPAVTSPVIAGYTADHPTVDAVANISATSNDVERKVTYKANAQKLTYTVIDETDSRTLADQVLLETGVSKGAVPTQAQTKYDQVVAGYQAQGYELVSQEALPTQFDTDDATDQNVTVRLRHKTVPVEETKTVTETIQYVYEDASQAAESKVQTLEFKRTNTKDLVADRIIQEGVWSPSESTFPAVTSPVIAGYTADHPTVDAVANISATSNDVERKVTYKANAQKLTYTVIDETASRTLADQVLLETGVSKGAVPTQAQTKYDQVVAGYQAQGYELVSQEALPTQFDTDDATDQNVTVRLRHKTVPVEETKTVTETIQYVYEDASQAAESKVQTLEFKRTNTKDLVADRIIQEGVWSPSESTFPAVTSPVIAGYTADHPTVDAVANISATSNDVERKVTYKANAQKLTYTVIDETASRTLADQVLLETGVSKGAVPTQAQTKYDQVVADYQAQGYELVSQEALPTQFDTDDATDQNVTVRLRHKTVPVEETKTVTETIQYVYEDASQAAESKVQTLEFKRTNTKDLVADRIIQEGVWSPSESTFPAVTSPVIAGYTADHPTVDAVANISATSNDVERKVTYKANAQKLTYTVIDETDSRTLADQVLLETGVSKGAVPTQAQTKYDQVVAGYQAQGYELVSQEALPTQFDTDDATDQNVTVRLRHKTVPVEETKTVTETIQYVYEDASQAAESKVQTLEFKRTNTKDLVADRIIQEGVWSPSESTFPAVTSPVIAGYTADHPTVDAVANISATSNDVERKVTYKANAQKLTYTVIDETDSRTLADQVLLETGVSKGAVPTQAQTTYDAVVAGYLAQNYELVSQEALPTQFDTDDATDQNVTVRLRHKTVPVEETKTVTETIQYVYEDASQAAESKVQTLEFKRTNTKDLVADRIIQEGVWSPSESTFPAVTSPVIAGYTADHPTVDAVANISATSNDVERKVTYKANAQKLTYTVIDETDSRTLADQVLLETGVSKGAVPTQAQTTYDAVVAGYLAQNYELVSQEALPTQFDTDDATDQNVTVRLRHKTVPVEETKTVTETIQYVYEDASQAAESKVQTLEFKRTNTKDLVADRIIQEGVWSPSESTFPAVTSPVIAGYTADHPTVDAVANISATSNDVERKVTYKANAQKLTYTVIDETASRTLADQVLLETGVSKGAVPTQAQTTYDAVVAGYLAQNYELVSQEALPTQFDTDDATDQNVTVRLRHKTVPVEETKTVTETIQYVYEDASQAAESKVQTLEFKRTNTKDLVADRIIQEGVWSPSESTFPAVTSPVIAGYTADHPTVDAVANISATSNDVERKVTYKANAQKLTYTVIDETASRTLADQVLLETGVSKGAVPTQAQTKYDQVVAGYQAQGYELVSQEALPTQFDTDDATDQNVTVRLRHKTVPVEETKTVTETIQYVYEDASQAAESKVQTLEFKRTNTKDLVADRIIQEGVWSPSESTFPAVTSPVIAGYTADHPTVDAVANISATSNDVERKVTYKANAQKLTYTVIDETASRTLADQVLLETGVSKGAVPTQAQTTYDAVVAGYLAQNYELVSQEALPTQFDTDDATDQNVTVRLRHKTVPVEETKTVTETIQYVYEDASQAAESKVQTLEFKRTNTKDLVADRIIQEGVWSPSESTFPAVTSPVIAGYTADHPTVDAVANISATSNDVERKVTYKANAQKLTYTVIDETTGQTLEDKVLLEKGVSNGAVSGQAQTTYDAVVAGYLAQNYELVSQEALPTQFDTDDATDQNVTVRLRHKTVPVEETKTVTETIQYVYEDASQAAESKVQTLEFKRTNTKDLVADRIIQEGVWSPSESTFPAVTSPVIAGYTADHPTVDAVANISATSNDVERKVTYKANAQKLTYTVIDETDSRTLADQVLLETGVSKGAVPTQAQTKYDQVVAGYQAQGYELVSQEALPTQFDTDDATDQNVTVRLRHKTVPVEETKTVTETIQYVYEDASQAAESKVQTLEFKRTNTKDLVADRIIQEGVWSPSESTFPAVTSPVIAGYTADHPTVDAVANISATSNDVERKVTYKANAQKLTYTVIDETASRTLADQVLLETGVSKGAVPTQAQTTYDAVVAGYLAQNYELVSQEALPTQFDTDDATDQNVTVRLRHKTVPVEETKTVTETIQYVYEDASQAAESKVQTLEFKRTNTKDLVADRIIQEGVWSPSESTFPAVTSPVIAGYTADHPTVDAVANISATSNDVERKVTYKANAQKLTYTVIDETTGQTLEDKVLLEKGVSNGAVSGQAQTTYDAVVAGYLAQNYELVSQEALPTQFDTDDATDQNVTVRLRHKTVPVEETKTVTETIQYVYEDASQAAESKVQTLEFKRTNTKDLVADRIIQEGVWSPSESTFPAVTSPVIAGYTADHPTVDAVANISATSNDVERKVTYKANAQKLTYTVIDETTGQTLEDKVLLEKGVSNGAVSGQAQTTYDAVVAGYLAQNYELVSQEALPNQFDTNDTVDQNVTIRLRHKTTSVAEEKTVKETIHYIYDGGATAAPDHTSSLKFTRTATTDLVTNVTTGDWTAENGTSFVAVTSPTIKGYTPDLAEVPAVDNITANSANIEKTVVYTANPASAKVTYIDDTTGETLETKDLNGLYGQTDPYRTAETIKTYTDRNYELVSDNYPTNGVTYNETLQTFEVHLRHKVTAVQETKIVTETIKYVYEDNTQAAATKVQTLDFERINTKDLVTNKIVHKGAWAPSTGTFPEVVSPKVDGYTPDKATVAAVEQITGDSADIEETVTYKADKQKVTYTIIDDTAQKTLKDKELLTSGNSDTPLPDSARERYDLMVNAYLAQGYELVSKEQLPAKFDLDSSHDQNVVVHLKHGTTDIQESKSVNLTVRYHGAGDQTPEDKVQTATWTRTVTKDKIRGTEVSTTPWTSDKVNYDAVPSPVIPGYSVDIATVPSEAVTQENIVKDVHYTIQTQKVTYTVVDETTGRTLENQVELTTGESGAALSPAAQVKYDTVVAGYLAQGYEVASQDALPGQFDTDSSVDQNVVIRLKHKVSTSTETKTVTQMINYVYEDDNTPAAPEKKSTLTFSREIKTDEVTKNTTPEAWTPSTGTFPEVVSPTVDGYTPDKAKVDAENVTANQDDITVTVKYKADKQKVTYTIIDDTTNTTLEDKKELTNGNSDTPLPNGTEAKYDSIVDAYLARGYELVSKDPLPAKFDLDSNYDQNVVVHLKHGTTDIQESKDVNLTVRYHGAGGQTPADQVQTATWTRTVKTDKVTGQPVSATAWTSDKANYDAVPSPVIPGYSVDIATVPAEAVTQENIVKDVHYTIQTQKVTYTVVDETIGQTLENQVELTTGESGAALPAAAQTKYDTIVAGYLAQGYEVASQDALPSQFDTDSSVDQNVVIRLKHGTTDSQESKSVNLTVRYHGAGSQTPADQVQTANWTRSVTTDKVTGQPVSATSWTSDKANYDAVPSPVIPGYTVDVATVPSEAVTQENIVKDVHYTAQNQKVTYTVVDETTGQTLEHQVELTTGDSGAALPVAAHTKYDTVVAGYLAQGYEVASQDALPSQFDTDSSVDQNVVIRLKHGTTDSQESKSVNLTVRYHGAGSQTPADQVQTATWTRTVTTDKVTGNPVSATAWTSDKTNYDAVPSPVIPGYSVDIATVPSEAVTQENIVKDVHYSAVPTTPEVPDTPVKPEPPVTPITPTQPKAQTTPAPVLPRTGEDTENAKVMTAAGIGALLTLIGIGTRRKKED